MASKGPKAEHHTSNTLTSTTSDSVLTSDGDGIKEVERVQTNATTRTVRERKFEPIGTGDREELTLLASTFNRREAVFSAQDIGAKPERKDSLDGIEFGDSVLDPMSPDFDAYKWARMYVLHLYEVTFG
jgi:hypothetical protein